MSEMQKLNLGCGFDREPEYINVDMSPECFPDVVWNMEHTPWPWEDNSVDEIKLQHVLEHVGQTTEAYLNIWKEIWRVCKNGAVIHIRVPHWDHENFYHDPTHVRAITPIGIAMFNQLRNIQDFEQGGSETKLGLFTGIDIDITDADIQYMYTREVVEALERGEFSREGLEHLRVHQNNIANEIRMTVRIVKPARGTEWLLAYKKKFAETQMSNLPKTTHEQIQTLSLDEITRLEQKGLYDDAYLELKKLPTHTAGLPAKIGWHMIRTGDFKNGYPLLHSERTSWRPEYIYALPLEKELPQGAPLAGKRIFIVKEGGQGDEIVGARFVELYKKAGAHVILGASESLHNIFSKLPITPDEIQNPETVQAYEYDYWAGSLRAPMYLQLAHPSTGITLPYLFADAKFKNKWKSIIDAVTNGKPKIGIRWQGAQLKNSNQLRVESIPLDSLLCLQELGQVFSFQQEKAVYELASHPGIYDLGSQLFSWDDTLACMEEMDYFVTCCTSTAHAAGALGIQTYVVTVTNPYFPWAKIGSNSDWYPSVTIARQQSFGNWNSAVAEVIQHIKKNPLPQSSLTTYTEEQQIQMFNTALVLGENGARNDARDTYRLLLSTLTGNTQLYNKVRYNLSWYEYKDGNISTASRYRVESGRELGFIINATRIYNGPKLTESTDVVGKSILLSNECGAGDEILSVRFAKILKSRGAKRVIWVSSNNLEKIFARVDGIDQAITPEEATYVEFDYWALTLELPYLLAVTNEDITTPAYITPLPQYVEKWKAKIGNPQDLKVGIRWKGEPSRDASQIRALPFSELQRITHIPGVTTYSLQRDTGVEDIPNDSHVIDLGSDFETWEDTVAAISLLDLIVTSDTSIAHLASAMGKETYVLVRSFPYFTWISNEQGKTPWYQSAQVYTESSKENWNDVIPKIEYKLKTKVGTQGTEDDLTEHITALYGDTARTMYIHRARELVSEILRTQQWYSKRDLILYNLFLAPGDVCFDVGANIGWYTLHAAQIVGNEGLVVAIEPDHANAALLRKNLQANAIQNVDVKELAVGSIENGETYLFKSTDNFGDHYTDTRMPAVTERTNVTVSTTTIDILAQKIRRNPRFIKIDVQGAEADVLRGAENVLQGKEKPVLLVEFAPACMLRIGASPFEFLAFIESHAYTPFRVYDDYAGRPLLAPLGIAELLEFIKENRTQVIGWDILLVPARDMHILQSQNAASLFI